MNNPNYERESANAVLDLLSLAGAVEVFCQVSLHGQTAELRLPSNYASIPRPPVRWVAWLRTSSQTLDRETGCGFTLSFLPCLEKVQCLCGFQGSQTGRQGKSRVFPCPYLLTASKRSLD